MRRVDKLRPAVAAALRERRPRDVACVADADPALRGAPIRELLAAREVWLEGASPEDAREILRKPLRPDLEIPEFAFEDLDLRMQRMAWHDPDGADRYEALIKARLASEAAEEPLVDAAPPVRPFEPPTRPKRR